MTATDKTTGKNESCAVDAVLRPNAFQPYVDQLAGLLNAAARDGVAARQAELDSALDGQPGRELRKLYTTEALRATGTYFAGSDLANRLVTSLATLLPNAKQVVDPACGAGDLLVACARYFPLKADLTETLCEWGGRLAGFDINPAFVEATRYRLALLAIERTQTSADEIGGELPLAEIFRQIQSRSGMAEWPLDHVPSVIVVNPPFSCGLAAKGCAWATGRVSQAAVFMDTCVGNASKGTRVLAILPDVLRTGTRYEKWRQMIAEKAIVHSVKIAGQFDDLTEINVFLLELEIGSRGKDQRIDWARPAQTAERTVKDLFHVHVGPVVPFRLDGKGP
jgi:N-6 DNA Methylase